MWCFIFFLFTSIIEETRYNGTQKDEKDEVIFEKAKEFYAERVESERKAHKEEQMRNIEERKNKMLEEQQQGQERAKKAEKYVPIKVNLGREKMN